MTQDYPSPNHGTGRGGAQIDMLVFHYTDMLSADAAVARMCDPSSQVSAHYLVARTGNIIALVDEADRAWHAGQSFWRGVRDVNSRSIGIELDNPGHSNGLVPFPPAQMKKLVQLVDDIRSRHIIPARNIVGHSDIAPGRKIDPGPLFAWRWLARRGIGLWPVPGKEVSSDMASRILRQIGYEKGDSADIEAFQRHYRPERIDGLLDAETASLVSGMLDFIIEEDF